jgi:hypothetical protein
MEVTVLRVLVLIASLLALGPQVLLADITAGGSSVNLSAPATTTTDLGAQLTPYRYLYLYGSGTYGTSSVRLGSLATTHRTLDLPDNTGQLFSTNSLNIAINSGFTFNSTSEFQIMNGYRLSFGTSPGYRMSYYINQTPDTMVFGLNQAVGNSFIVTENGDIDSFDYAVPLQTHPTFVFSSGNKDVNQRGAVRHNGTQFEVTDLAATAAQAKPVRLMGGSTVASASTITPTGNVFHVSGSATIDTITVMGAGSTITLIFDGTATVSDGVGNVKLPAAFVATADDTLDLVSDGAGWYYAGSGVN